MKPEYMPITIDEKLGYLVEECGEVLHAVGKTQRWGLWCAMSVCHQTGEAACGLPFMKFTLIYDGELRANGNPRHKQEIREHFAPQLEELWRVSLPLQHVRRNRWVARKVGYGKPIIHHSVDHLYDFSAEEPPPAQADYLDTIAPIDVGGIRFIPLVRDSVALCCGLKILYMRKEEPGRLVHQGGDIDNRLKTLFDALAMPNSDQLSGLSHPISPIYCLLEDDRLISGFSVETQRLLGRSGANHHEVRLIIEVDVRVTQARAYNQPFLGD